MLCALVWRRAEGLPIGIDLFFTQSRENMNLMVTIRQLYGTVIRIVHPRLSRILVQ